MSELNYINDGSEAEDIKVSVIMPIYNAYDYLVPAMDSVIDQTLKEIEIICIDDGSTDHSLDILKKYRETDKRVRIVTETNAGPAVARNNGLRRARGEYLAFLDADDFFELNMLEDMYLEAKSKDLDIAIARYDIYNSKKSSFRANVESEYGNIYADGRVTAKNEYPDVILQSASGSAWNKLFKRSFVEEKNLQFLSEVKMFEDVYFTVCALALAERIGKLPSVLMHHRIYNEQSRARLFKKYYTQVPFVYLEIKSFLMKSGLYEPLVKSYLNLSCSRCYYIYNLLAGDERSKFWDMLHDEYAVKLGWNDHPVGDFYKNEVCEFCANVEMYTHRQYRKRVEKGVRLEHDKIDKKLKWADRKKSIKTALKKNKKK